MVRFDGGGGQPPPPSNLVSNKQPAHLRGALSYTFFVAMPKSFCQVYVHAIFSTKNRVPVLDADLRPDMYALMGGILNQNGGTPIRIGGVEDHVHLLFGLGKKLTIPKEMEIVKTGTSKWIKTQREACGDFHWQAGYGAFSVDNSNVGMIARYIETQERHHASQSFQQEYLKILKKLGIEYDEEYLWD